MPTWQTTPQADLEQPAHNTKNVLIVMNSIKKISGGLSEEQETRHGQQIATSPYTEANLLRHQNFEFHFDSCNKKLVRIARIWIPKLLRDRAFLFFFSPEAAEKIGPSSRTASPCSRACARAKNARAKSRSTLPTRPISTLGWLGGRRRGHRGFRPPGIKLVNLLGMLPRFQLY